jgi:hypothetical protein
MNVLHSLLFNVLIAFTSYQANKQKIWRYRPPSVLLSPPGVGASGIGTQNKKTSFLRLVRYVPWVCGHFSCHLLLLGFVRAADFRSMMSRSVLIGSVHISWTKGLPELSELYMAQGPKQVNKIMK